MQSCKEHLCIKFVDHSLFSRAQVTYVGENFGCDGIVHVEVKGVGVVAGRSGRNVAM